MTVLVRFPRAGRTGVPREERIGHRAEQSATIPSVAQRKKAAFARWTSAARRKGRAGSRSASGSSGSSRCVSRITRTTTAASSATVEPEKKSGPPGVARHELAEAGEDEARQEHRPPRTARRARPSFRGQAKERRERSRSGSPRRCPRPGPAVARAEDEEERVEVLTRRHGEPRVRRARGIGHQRLEVALLGAARPPRRRRRPPTLGGPRRRPTAAVQVVDDATAAEEEDALSAAARAPGHGQERLRLPRHGRETSTTGTSAAG